LGKLIKDDKKVKTLISYEDIAPSIEENEEFSYRIDDKESNIWEAITIISNSIKNELETQILTENEIKIGRALVSILENWESVFEHQTSTNKYNKNLILYYIREMTSLETKDIRIAMKRFKTIYKLVKNGGL
jgi:hypothetical protein